MEAVHPDAWNPDSVGMAFGLRLETLKSATSLDDVLEWLQLARKEGVDICGGNNVSEAAEEATAFAATVRELKSQLTPHNHPDVKAAAMSCCTEDDYRAVLAKVPRHEEFKRAFDDLAILVGYLRERSPGSRNARRAAHVVRADDAQLFTPHAGKVTLPSDASVDRFGNAVDSAFHLARDGACRGYKALVLIPFDPRDDKWPETWYGCFVDAMMLKGLEVNVVTHEDMEILTPVELETMLQGVTVCCLISGKDRMLHSGHIRVLKRAWRSGLGLYVAGDNDPYNVDANAVLAAIGLPQMDGNFEGMKVLTLEDDMYVAHAVTTGIRGGLYSGVTVADFDVWTKLSPAQDDPPDEDEDGVDGDKKDGDDEDDITVPPGKPITYKVLAYTGQQQRHGRKPVGIIVHEGSAWSGRVVADGAFTRLYVDWEKHGTPQYFGNAVAFLVSKSSEACSPFTSPPPPGLVLDYAGAPSFTCAVTHEDTSSGGFVMLYGGSPLDCITDAMLSDPLATGLGLGADLVSTVVLGGPVLLDHVMNTQCPFTRRPVLATIPLVKLNSATNQRLVARILMGVFTDGRFPRAAWLMFFGVCVRALQRNRDGVVAGAGGGDAEDRTPYGFLVQEMLDNLSMSAAFNSSPPFVSFRQAINAYARPSTTDPAGRLRKSLSTIVDGMAPFLDDQDMAPVWIRHKRMYQALQEVRSAAITGKWQRRDFVKALCQYFECSFGIVPISGTARVPGMSAGDKWFHVLALMTLMGSPQRFSLKTDQFLAVELKEQPTSLLATAWTGGYPGYLFDEDVEAAVDLRGALEVLFSGYQKVPSGSAARIPPFATVLGPSVLFAADGTAFLDACPESEEEDGSGSGYCRADDFDRRVLKCARAKKRYMQATFGADAPDTACTYPLHALTRVVMVTQFPTVLEYAPEQAAAVARALFDRAQGNIFTQDFEVVVTFAVKSYLEARRRNMALPEAERLHETKQLRVAFAKQMEAEIRAGPSLPAR
jgi:hypothetical protein